MTDARLQAEEKQDTAQPPADTRVFSSSCRTGTDVITRSTEDPGAEAQGFGI